MSTVADVQAAAPSFARLQKPTPRITGRRQSGVEASMSWIVDRDQANAAFQKIGGTYETFASLGVTVTRLVPLKHPEFPWLIAEEIDAEYCGWEGDPATAIADETHVKVKVVFRYPQFDLSGNQAFCEISGNPAARQIATPLNAYQAGATPFRAMGEHVNGADLQVVLHQVPSFNLGYLMQYANTVNAVPFLGNPPGAVMYMGPTFQVSQQLGGVTSWRIGLGFRVTDPWVPWNYEYDATGSLTKILHADGSPMYDEVDPTNWIAL